MSAIHHLAKSCIVAVLGTESRPRKIVRGIARGYTISVSPAKDLSYLLGTAEPHLQRTILEHVHPGDTVYDIGANIGYVSMSLSRRVGPQGKVFAFEPIPRNADLLRQNIENNRISNVRVLQLAASDSDGRAPIRWTENFATASMIWHRDNPSAVELSVQIARADRLVEGGEIPLPQFVKIDVESSEGLVVSGMQRTLATSRPAIFLECSDTGRESTWQLLRDLGYTCRRAANRIPVNRFEDYRHADFLWLPA